MYYDAKYVTFEMPDGTTESFIFHKTVVHYEFAKRIRGRPIGAGFVVLRDDILYPVGRSESLNLDPHEDDKYNLNRVFYGHSFPKDTLKVF